MGHWKGLIYKTLLILFFAFIAVLHITSSQTTLPISNSVESNRNLQLGEFYKSVVAPFIAALKQKFPNGFRFGDYFEEDLSPVIEGNDETDGDFDSIIWKESDHYDNSSRTSYVSESQRLGFVCDSPDYREFSFPVAGKMNEMQLHDFLHGYTYCRASKGAYGDDFDITDQDGSDPLIWPKDLDVFISSANDKYLGATCCSQSGICQDIQEDFNLFSSCFKDENFLSLQNEISESLESEFHALAPVLCIQTESFAFALTEDGESADIEEHRLLVEDYLECSASYERFDLPSVAVQINTDTSSLDVTCYSCNFFNFTYDSCIDLRDKFLEPSLCSSELTGVFYYTGDDTTISELLECEPQDSPVYTESLSLPSEYFFGDDESSVLDSLNEFLQCRLNTGAYGFLSVDDFPTFEFIGIELDEITGDDYFTYDDDWYYYGCDYDDSRRLTHTNDYVYMPLYYGNVGDDLPIMDDYMNQNDGGYYMDELPIMDDNMNQNDDWYYMNQNDDWYYMNQNDDGDYMNQNDDGYYMNQNDDGYYMNQNDDWYYMNQNDDWYYMNQNDDWYYMHQNDDWYYMNQNDDYMYQNPYYQNDYFYNMDDWSNYYCPDDLYQDDYFDKEPTGNVTIICHDKCENGALCRDILTQFTAELACITKYTCRFDVWDAIHIDYEVEFQTGEQFESYTWQYQKDVEMRMERNFDEYIKCRFEDDPRYYEFSFDVYGWIWDSTFNLVCYSECNSIPYCDALRLRRKEDSKDDLCYEKWIEVGDDERVNTVYDYSIDYGSTANGLTGLFSYNVQSMSRDPIMRQYYGSWALSDLPALTSALEATQASQLKNLMELYGFNEPDVNFNDVCTHLTDHIKCEENKRIIQIDMEIPNGNGFKANTIKNHFGNALQSLTLGINLQEPKDLPNTFFEIPGLITLTLRGRGKLIGSLPTSLGDLSELKNLDLNQCPFLGNDHEGIAGPIPPEIGLLPMKLIDLGCNKFTGEIPDEFYKNTDETPKFYKVITLNDNNFMGTISDDLNYMFTLTQLSLARNRFSGAFPSSLFLWKLKLLDAQKNRDPEITNCAQESASGNYGFTGPLPDILKNPLSRLEVLSLSDNCFTGTIPREIKLIENLRYLNLQNNDLTGTIPRQVVKCENLEVLLLGGNPQLDYYVHPKTREFLTERGVIHDLTW